MRDQARWASVILRRQRDAAVAERYRACQVSAILEQQQAATIEELRVARDSLSQSRTEVESAQRPNAQLQDDLRRVNNLLVAHAEELRPVVPTSGSRVSSTTPVGGVGIQPRAFSRGSFGSCVSLQHCIPFADHLRCRRRILSTRLARPVRRVRRTNRGRQPHAFRRP
ncbi:hypothetical protein PF003_g11323 [Phytophthora fragariae]|nr:hypothetical protein PF003_g11323 [Phytophthora fragariae]